MISVIKRVGIIGSMIIVAPAIIGGVALADEASCSALMRNNLAQEISSAVPGLTQAELCLENVSGSEALEQADGLSRVELKASKQLLCGRSKPIKKVKANQRALRNLVGQQLVREHEQCLALSKKGVAVLFNTPTPERGIVNIALELNKPGIELREVSVEPADSMSCLGFASNTGLDNQSLWGVCEHNPDSIAPVSIIRVRLSRGLLNIRVQNPAIEGASAETGGVRWQRAALPSIPGCRTLSVADRILSCSDHLGQVLCNRELMAGNVLDCRTELASRIYPNRAETQIHYERGEFEYSQHGVLGVTVRRNRPEQGVLAGQVTYTANFDTPILRERSSNLCDRSCPLFDDEPCNRNCLVADNILETEQALGVLSLTREQGDSCSQPIDGTITLTEIDKYRAYNLCEARNAWGHTTSGVVHVKVSKYFYMNDYRTSHVVIRGEHNGRSYTDEQWALTNEGTRVRSIATLEIPFTAYCNG